MSVRGNAIDMLNFNRVQSWKREREGGGMHHELNEEILFRAKGRFRLGEIGKSYSNHLIHHGNPADTHGALGCKILSLIFRKEREVNHSEQHRYSLQAFSSLWKLRDKKKKSYLK